MESKQDNVKVKILNIKDIDEFKLNVSGNVVAGFPSPASDYIENELDLKTYLIKNESSTFFVRAEGNSMINDHICDGDLLVIDKAFKPGKNSILMCYLDGAFTIKKFSKIGKEFYLIPSNPEFEPIKVDENSDFRLWGRVRFSIHEHK